MTPEEMKAWIAAAPYEELLRVLHEVAHVEEPDILVVARLRKILDVYQAQVREVERKEG